MVLGGAQGNTPGLGRVNYSQSHWCPGPRAYPQPQTIGNWWTVPAQVTLTPDMPVDDPWTTGLGGRTVAGSTLEPAEGRQA